VFGIVVQSVFLLENASKLLLFFLISAHQNYWKTLKKHPFDIFHVKHNFETHLSAISTTKTNSLSQLPNYVKQTRACVCPNQPKL
jgi:hypothetical protein